MFAFVMKLTLRAFEYIVHTGGIISRLHFGTKVSATVIKSYSPELIVQLQVEI